jgi:hypothetical protein
VAAGALQLEHGPSCYGTSLLRSSVLQADSQGDVVKVSEFSGNCGSRHPHYAQWRCDVAARAVHTSVVPMVASASRMTAALCIVAGKITCTTTRHQYLANSSPDCRCTLQVGVLKPLLHNGLSRRIHSL